MLCAPIRYTPQLLPARVSSYSAISHMYIRCCLSPRRELWTRLPSRLLPLLLYLFCLWVHLKEKTFNNLHKGSVNYIPFKMAKVFLLPLFCAPLFFKTNGWKATDVFPRAKSTLITEGIEKKKSEFLWFLTLYSKSINTHGFNMMEPAGSQLMDWLCSWW